MDYEVACVCGRAMRGERLARHQVVACPGCGRGVFVLPSSPFGKAKPVTPAVGWNWRPWRGPMVAAVVCGVVMLAGFAAALPFLWRSDRAEAAKNKAIIDPQEVRPVVAAARRALQEGKIHLAARLIDEALQMRKRQRDQLAPAESRELEQMWREMQLVARLSSRSLEDVVRHGRLVRDPEEWASYFVEYQGRTVVFDDVVRRDGEGVPVLANHTVEVPGVAVRLALEDLAVLRDLPLDDEPRLIFGARIARCAREERGVWVLRFEPDSGVLLTDVSAVEACFPAPPDEELRATLQRQKAWLAER